MSSFQVTTASLETLGNHLYQWANRTAKMGDLPTDDFGVWTGDPEVGVLMSDFSKTLKNEIKEYAMTLGLLSGALLDGAKAYREVDRSNANRLADH